MSILRKSHNQAGVTVIGAVVGIALAIIGIFVLGASTLLGVLLIVIGVLVALFA